MQRQLDKHLVCPWCKKGEVLADNNAEVIISACCPKCGRFYTGNLITLKTEKAVAQKRGL